MRMRAIGAMGGYFKPARPIGLQPRMRDVYLPIAQALANPLRTPQQRLLYQLWRADLPALCRLALVCQDAAEAARWLLRTLGARERERRAQVAQARAFLEAAPLLASASWTRLVSAFMSDRAHLRSLVRVAFNGRIRIREYLFGGRRQRQKQTASPLVNYVGLTLTSSTHGRLFIAIQFGLAGRLIVWSGTFTGHEGVLASVRRLLYLGREHWRRIEPEEYIGLELQSDWELLSLNLTRH
jgi:hypothetical protein